MACDYGAIRRDNERRYGTDIGRIGPMLLANRYDDRSHFIYELLQNAEDALARRRGWGGSRAVSFQLEETALRVSHFGLPFDERDVRGICGIAESTKDLTSIGRFGIGFKSVYAFSDRPEIHSGAESFAIESFVWPVAARTVPREEDETVILVPLRSGDDSARAEIAAGLARLGASSLLFLREIEEIRWSVKGESTGLYLRETREIGPGVRRVTVIGQERGEPEVDEEWLVFSRSVSTDGGAIAGNVELAWKVAAEEAGRSSLRAVERSPLVVFFPTVLETHLGFLIQGPYRTTPSRDNVPGRDDWNRHCVGQTDELLREALRWLRDQGLLDVAGLRCLPIDSSRFPETSMFRPLFDATKGALISEELLPAFGSGYTSAGRSRLARTQDLRELLDSTQLSALYEQTTPLRWLSADISQDRAPELRQYLMRELEIPEVTSETILPKLSEAFLREQSDGWIQRLYEFLSSHPALRRRVAQLPVVRLSDGSHVPARIDDEPQAFLPGPLETGFPTVRREVCQTEAARDFLESLGLTEPDPVDDVIWNVLPKYGNDGPDVAVAEYESDIGRTLGAFATDSKAQREKLIEALRQTAWVMAVDAGNGKGRRARPGEVYLATERLTALFADIEGILLVDGGVACLRGEPVRELLEAAGATRYLQPIEADCDLSWDERAGIRREAGLERSTWEDPIADLTLRGLEESLALLRTLEPEARRERSRLLWDALEELHDRRGSRAFEARYRWGYSHETKTATLDAAFVRALNEREWVPDARGDLRQPALIVFDDLGWKPSPFLLSKIHFKPPIIEQLAKEAGIEPGVLDLLRKLGVTSEADLRRRLGVEDEGAAEGGQSGDLERALDDLLGDAPRPSPPATDPGSEEPPTAGGTGSDGTVGRTAATGRGSAPGPGEGRGRAHDTGVRRGDPGQSSEHPGGRPFISYVAAHPDEEAPDPDGLDQTGRMELERQAIELILSREAGWHRAPTHNPGFDLYQGAGLEAATQWCEVKAMTGTLEDRPVGLSCTQFECARERGAAYWLYVVERAGTADARVVRIQDPAGKAATFTFDQGWRGVAEPDSEARED